MPDDLAAGLADIIASVVQPLAARLATAETSIAVLTAMAARVETVDARVQDLATKDLGSLRERMAITETRPPLTGPPGKDGRDGWSPSDFSFTYEGNRRFAIKWLHGESEAAHAVTVPGMPLYRGVWAAGTYEAGDMVTWSGGTWHCGAPETTAKPGDSPDWVLMVKRGRDGKDGRP